MELVADTSTFLAVALREPVRDAIIRKTEGAELLAPEVLPFEAGNALSAMIRRRSLAPDALLSAWDAFQSIPVELVRIDYRKSLEIVVEFGVYAYDAYFLECARGTGSPLLTLDKGMIEVARRMNLAVMELEQ